MLAVSDCLCWPQYFILDVLLETPGLHLVLLIGSLDEHEVLLDFDSELFALPLYPLLQRIQESQFLLNSKLLPTRNIHDRLMAAYLADPLVALCMSLHECLVSCFDLLEFSQCSFLLQPQACGGPF